ncbi:MAG: copper ion binding protein [Desulfohalobiaceae bacterium]|nr:copper ion binding protein [Desulfohalobiaceae bacterium]
MRVKVKGMSCQHCVNSVTKALQQLDGVKNVEVSLDQGEARYEEDKPVDRETVRKAVQDAGYDVGEFEDS